ncbi:hypothetical protein FRC11_010375, partial [Ceratobasidium sp. 423]
HDRSYLLAMRPPRFMQLTGPSSLVLQVLAENMAAPIDKLPELVGNLLAPIQNLPVAAENPPTPVENPPQANIHKPHFPGHLPEDVPVGGFQDSMAYDTSRMAS